MVKINKFKKSFTLVELLIAISLFIIVLGGAFVFDLSARKFLRTSERTLKVLDDMTFILSHIQKNAAMATGDISGTNPGFNVTAIGSDFQWDIRQDINGTTGLENRTPWTYTDDRWVRYEWNHTSFQLRFLPNRDVSTVFEILRGNVTSITVTMNYTAGGINVSDLILLYNGTQAKDSINNPQVTMDQIGQSGEQFFGSFSHSW